MPLARTALPIDTLGGSNFGLGRCIDSSKKAKARVMGSSYIRSKIAGATSVLKTPPSMPPTDIQT